MKPFPLVVVALLKLQCFIESDGLLLIRKFAVEGCVRKVLAMPHDAAQCLPFFVFPCVVQHGTQIFENDLKAMFMSGDSTEIIKCVGGVKTLGTVLSLRTSCHPT